jgi:hypothetical protein
MTTVPIYNKDDIANYCKIDEDNFDKVNKIRWNFDRGYAVNFKIGRMHRFIINAQKGGRCRSYQWR